MFLSEPAFEDSLAPQPPFGESGWERGLSFITMYLLGHLLFFWTRLQLRLSWLRFAMATAVWGVEAQGQRVVGIGPRARCP